VRLWRASQKAHSIDRLAFITGKPCQECVAAACPPLQREPPNYLTRESSFLERIISLVLVHADQPDSSISPLVSKNVQEAMACPAVVVPHVSDIGRYHLLLHREQL